MQYAARRNPTSKHHLLHSLGLGFRVFRLRGFVEYRFENQPHSPSSKSRSDPILNPSYTAVVKDAPERLLFIKPSTVGPEHTLPLNPKLQTLNRGLHHGTQGLRKRAMLTGMQGDLPRRERCWAQMGVSANRGPEYSIPKN